MRSFSSLDKPEGIEIDSNVSKLLQDYVDVKNDFTGQLRSALEATFKAFLFIYLAAYDDLEPLILNVETELPVGAGLGSSASFAVALAGGLLAASGRTKPGAEQDADMVMPQLSIRMHIPGKLQLQFWNFTIESLQILDK